MTVLNNMLRHKLNQMRLTQSEVCAKCRTQAVCVPAVRLKSNTLTIATVMYKQNTVSSRWLFLW